MRKQFFGGTLQHGPMVIFALLKWDTLCDHNSSYMSEKYFWVGGGGGCWRGRVGVVGCEEGQCFGHLQHGKKVTR